MKHLYFKSILLGLCLFLGLNVFAYDAEINGIYYRFSENNAIVTYKYKYYGNYAYYTPDYIDDIVIPEFVNYNNHTYSVTSIGDNAFAGCAGLTSIAIPTSVTSIGNSAFSYCSSLTSVTIPESVTSIGGSAFFDCSSLTSISIPNNITSIGMQSFCGCSSLTSITIPESITTIDERAFAQCSSLTSITIPTSVTSIGSSVFEYCGSLSDVYCYAENVPVTKSDAFDNTNVSLATLHVPAGSVNWYKSTAPWSIFGLTIGIGEVINTETVNITSAEDLANFAARVNAGETSLNAVLKTDVDFTAYPNVSIGASVYYRGEFDGSGHSIKLGLTPTTYNAALFGNLLGHVHDLITTGTITTSEKFAAGIAAQTRNCIIERCQSRVVIDSSVNGDGTHGGIAGITYNGTIIRDCLVSGSITGGQTNCCGGVSGWADGTTTISNCLIRSQFSVGTTDSDLLSRNSNNVISSNNYFQGEWDADNNCGNVTILTENQVKSGEACYLLNDGRTGDERVWYQTLGEDDYPVPDDSHQPVWFIEGSYVNATQFTINFDTNGGSPIESITQDYGSTITPPENPTKEGYTFVGWKPAIPETMPEGGLTVVAQWQVNSYTLSYIVDGEEYKTSSINYGTTLTPEPTPTKEGYTFSGWSEIPETMPAENVTVTGSFTINQYLLTYILDGEEYKSYEIDYNTALTPEPAPTKKGMTFSGWGEMPATMPAHDVTLTGAYTWSKETVDGVVYQVADTLNNYATIVGYEGTDGKAEILSYIEIGGDIYEVYSIADNALQKSVTIYTSAGRLLLWLWTNGYANIRETETGNSLSAPEVSLVGATASSLKLSFANPYPELNEMLTVSGAPVEKGENGYEIALNGLEPDNLYDELASVTLTYEDASYTKSYSYRTKPLTLTALQPKVVSIGNVIVVAESNLDDDETNVGFEWRRIDWTDDFESRTGAAYLYEGIMEGYIRNLNADRLWKFRPYYTSNAGNTYYSDWKGMDPSDYSFFEPTVHTYEPIAVTDSTAEVKGYAMQGTDDVASQGFMYWQTTSPASSRMRANGAPEDATVVEVPGHVMKTTLAGLDYDTEYCFVAFVKTGNGAIFYGEQQSFRTTSDPDGIKEIAESQQTTDNGQQSIYDLSGRKLAEPQKGINIIRYSDGTSKKVLIK